MTPLLRSYLADVVSPEQNESLERAFDVFDEIGLDFVAFEYDQLLMTGDDLDTDELVGRIVGITAEFQEKILADHGVYLSDEATLEDRTFFIRNILVIPAAECRDDIVTTILGSTNDEERFCEIVSLVSERTADELLPLVEKISPALIARIRETFSGDEVPDEEDSSDVESDKKRIDSARDLMSAINDNKLMAVELLRRGLPVGLPYTAYADIYSDDFEKLPPALIAANLLFIALISSESETALQTVKSSLETYVRDPALTTKVDIKVTELFLTYQTYVSKKSTEGVQNVS